MYDYGDTLTQITTYELVIVFLPHFSNNNSNQGLLLYCRTWL